jgi:hypothetical protein
VNNFPRQTEGSSADDERQTSSLNGSTHHSAPHSACPVVKDNC